LISTRNKTYSHKAVGSKLGGGNGEKRTSLDESMNLGERRGKTKQGTALISWVRSSEKSDQFNCTIQRARHQSGARPMGWQGTEG